MLRAAAMKLLGAIDQGTTSTRFIVFDQAGKVVSSAQQELPQIMPKEKWTEHNPQTILETVETCIGKVCAELTSKGYTPQNDIASIGVTNQRETTVLWDSATGKALHNAIVWLDLRTAETVAKLVEKTPTKNRNYFQGKCGLPITTYFSAVKANWLLNQPDPEIAKAHKEGRVRFSTIDTWIIWNLTGGLNGGAFVTDVTNASRTMLMDLKTLAWDDELCSFFGVDKTMLPEIRSSSETYGVLKSGPLAGVPISGCAGDQQAALVGHRCFRSGEVKSTYGTGCFVLFNTGEKPIFSKHGLITTVGYQLGPNAKPAFALEGSISNAGSVVNWLRDKLGLINDYSDIELLASKVDYNTSVYFVPALSGLFAPRWREDACGVIVGLTQFADKNHICRAALEGVCFQTKEVIDAMEQDSGEKLRGLKVDGGLTSSNTCMQIQSDLLNVPIHRPQMKEMTALGAAILAGLAVGVWPSIDDLVLQQTMQEFTPKMTPEDRLARVAGWERAVKASLDMVSKAVV